MLKRAIIKLFIIGLMVSSCSYTPVSVSPINDYQPDLRPIPAGTGKPDDYLYLTKEDYEFQFKLNGKQYKGIVPAGFISDGTSVPWYLWSVTGLTRDGLERGASWVHDWMYVNDGNVPLQVLNENGNWENTSLVFNQGDADSLFYYSLLAFNVSATRAKGMFDAVEKYGTTMWNSHKQKTNGPEMAKQLKARK
jgi:hypothetical protein